MEKFMEHLEPSLKQAERESKARDLARKDLLPSFFKWTRKRIAVEIKHHALAGKKGNKVKAPVRAASLFREKQQLAQSIAQHFEIVYRKRKEWSASERLAFLAEMKAGLLKAKQELGKQKTMSLNEKLDELGKWKNRGVRVDERIEDSFLREASKAVRETERAVINTLLASINKKIKEVQKEMKQG